MTPQQKREIKVYAVIVGFTPVLALAFLYLLGLLH